MPSKFTVALKRKKNPSLTYSDGRVRPAFDRKGVASVENAVSILRILEFAAGPLSLGQIARAAGYQSSKTHHYLVSLVRTELAQQDATTGLYSLGAYARRLGKPARHKGNLAPLVSEAMRNFSETTRQAALFAQWSKQGPVVTHWSDGRRALSVSARIGALMPLWGSPTGDIFLAWLPSKVLAQAMLDRLGVGVNERHLRSVQARTRSEGGSHAAGRRNASIAAIAVPVFEEGGLLVGAMTAVGLVGDLDDSPGSAASELLRLAAAKVSAALGFDSSRQS